MRNWFCCFLISLCLFPVAKGQEEARIRSVRFTGNQTFGKGELMEVIQLKPTNIISRLVFKKGVNYFSEQQYEADQLNIIHFYQNEGFPDVVMAPLSYRLSKNGKRIRIVYDIREGEPYVFGKINYQTDSAAYALPRLTRREKRFLSYRIASKKGERVREEAIRNDQQLLVQTVGDGGYPYASVEPMLQPDTLTRQANLTWQIQRNHPAFFSTTSLEGTSVVAPRKVMRQLQYKQGESWSQKKLDDTQKSIFALGVFSVVSVKALIGQEKPDSIPIRIFLKDAPRLSSRFGIGYGREERLRTFVELQLLRFPGGVSRVTLNTRYSYIEPINVSLKFTQPAFPFRSSNLQLNPYFILQNEPAYELRRYGGEAGLLYRFGNYLTSNLTLYTENINLALVNKDLVYDPAATAKVYDKAGVSAGAIYSSLTPQLDPETGFSASANVKWNTALLNGRYPFVRFLGKVVYYYRVNRTVILASKYQLGGIQPVENGSFIPIDERFFGGGNASVRGWSRHQLGPVNAEGDPVGGLSTMEFSVEPRVQVMNNVVVALFLDGGNVWRNSMTYRFNDLRFAAGFGIRVKTPIGPVGIDLARPVVDVEKSWQLHLNIGNPF